MPIKRLLSLIIGIYLTSEEKQLISNTRQLIDLHRFAVNGKQVKNNCLYLFFLHLKLFIYMPLSIHHLSHLT